MSKETYNQIVDEIYNTYTNKYIGYDDVPSKSLFLFEIKTNPNFSEKWGLKIEERELSLGEREKLAIDRYPRLNEIPYGALVDMQPFTNEFGNSLNIPTQLITLTYKNETIESYE